MTPSEPFALLESPAIRVSQAEFARHERVAKSTVTRWIQAGRISVGEDGLIDLEQGHAERLATESPLAKHQARKAQFEAAKDAKAQAQAQAENAAQGRSEAPGAIQPPQAQATADSAPPGIPEAPAAAIAPAALSESANIGVALKFETYRLQKAKAEQANIEIDKSVGLLVERAEVDFILADFAIVVRDHLDSLPDRIVPDLAACRGDPAALRQRLAEAVHDLLGSLNATLARRIEGLTA